LQSLGRNAEAAAIRAAPAGNGGRPSPPDARVNLQDPAVLARMAHVSEKFDRALLRTNGEDPPAPRPRK
jgi:hypothetical protein